MTASIKDRRIPVLRVDGNAVLEFMLTSDGFLDIYATIYDSKGRQAVEIRGGFGWTVNENLAVRVRNKKSALEVIEGDKVLLRVNRSSPTTAEVEGSFYSPGSTEHFDIDSDSVKQGEYSMQNVCLSHLGSGFSVWTKPPPRPPFRANRPNLPTWEFRR